MRACVRAVLIGWKALSFSGTFYVLAQVYKDSVHCANVDSCSFLCLGMCGWCELITMVKIHSSQPPRHISAMRLRHKRQRSGWCFHWAWNHFEQSVFLAALKSSSTIKLYASTSIVALWELCEQDSVTRHRREQFRVKITTGFCSRS